MTADGSWSWRRNEVYTIMELKGFKKSWVMKKLLGVCQLYVGPYYLYICILLAENTLPQRITIPARWDDHGFDTNQ
jgi:hypothetical protein